MDLTNLRILVNDLRYLVLAVNIYIVCIVSTLGSTEILKYFYFQSSFK